MNIKEEYYKIKGMSCPNCEITIETLLLNTNGINSVSANYNLSLLKIIYDVDIINVKEIDLLLKEKGYSLDFAISKKKSVMKYTALLSGILIILLAVFIIFSRFELFTKLNVFPSPQNNDTELIMLFVIGFLTSFHCLAMCGAINLSQSINKSNSKVNFKGTLLYNGGRVISYTIIGIIVGGIGSVFSFNAISKGIIIVIASTLMLLMGLSQLNIIPSLKKITPRLPKRFANIINNQKLKNSSPFIVGLLNGLMPCGPLQTMQIYALAVGSWYLGGLSMFIFALGTVPLMFLLGSLANIFTRNFSKKIMYISASVIMFLSLFMFSNGTNLLGLNVNALFKDNKNYVIAVINDNQQLVSYDLENGKYKSIQVNQNILVNWKINVSSKDLNSCNEEFIIKEYNLNIKLHIGENIINFTPTKKGEFTYVCWMGMRKAYIKVI
ncbi:MAG: sulfite exporter TauE/SafE family protein [Bacillales bacterium]|jgi:sulfite exporter TauE/SafE/copper chaperone CopZ|nr:sulfite exporter TauE/SafE family protein [Bacillales bacterium]